MSKPLDKMMKELYEKRLWLQRQEREGRIRGVSESSLALERAKAKSLNLMLRDLRKLKAKGQKTISMKRAESMMKKIVHEEMHTQNIWRGM